MAHKKGFATITILLIALGVALLGGAGYIAMNPEVLHAPVNDTAKEDNGAATTEKSSIAWRLESAGETEGMPYTNVTAVINGKAYDMGKFIGSCSEIGANGGIDGKGLLAGELSATQCWFAGGGNEIGVFASEDGGFEIMVGELSEGEEGSGMFRGGFSIKNIVKL